MFSNKNEDENEFNKINFNKININKEKDDDISPTEETQIINSWDELNIKQELLRGIYANGFESPSPIQRKAIVPIINGLDVIAQAQSGTGKTGCFTIAALQLIDTNKLEVQVIILSPTRELSFQTKSVIDCIGCNINNLRTQLLVGGTSSDIDMKKLKENIPQIAIGCPGRVHDMIRRKQLNCSNIKLIILDEADEMLSVGFKDQVYNIFQYMPNDIQITLFSATMPPNLYNLTEKFMRNPIKITVKAEQLTLEGIKQYYVNLEDDNQKYDTLKDLFSCFSVSQCIIYCNSVRRVADLYEAMLHDGYPVCQIHSSLDKEERFKNFEQFKNGTHRVLISSNVTARGIDIQQVSTVINFDIPKCCNTYLHRIGRSGRWGRKGSAINFITRRDYKLLKDIESFYSTSIVELPKDYQ
jgi:translation initiation factor 4A